MWGQIRQAAHTGQETILASSAFEKDLEAVTDNHFNMLFPSYALAAALLQWGVMHRIKLSCNLFCIGKTVMTVTRFIFHI